MILAFGAVAATCVLIDRSIAVCNDTAPATQDGTAPGLRGTRQPCPGAVGHGLGAGGGNAVGRAVQNDRVTRSTTLWQKHKGIEPDAVTHRDHSLEAACAAGVLSVHWWPLLLPSLHRLRLTERCTMHQARLGLDIIEGPGVQDASVVPEHSITDPPSVAILIGRLAGVSRQLSNKLTCPVLWPANNA